MSQITRLRDIRGLLPWYVNGSLPDADRRAVEAELATSPELQAEARWLASLRSHLQADKGADGFDEAGVLSLISARVQALQEGKVVSLAPRRQTSWQKTLLALAATVILAQAGVIGFLVTRNADEPGIQPLAGNPAPRGDQLQVVFRSTATEGQIRGILHSIGGDVIAGPGALGVYTVRVPAGMRFTVAERLRGDSVVESVALVEQR